MISSSVLSGLEGRLGTGPPALGTWRDDWGQVHPALGNGSIGGGIIGRQIHCRFTAGTMPKITVLRTAHRIGFPGLPGFARTGRRRDNRCSPPVRP